MTMALTYGATLWQELEAMRIPGIKAVYCPPEGAGRFIAIISVKQMYPGHANQVGTAAISTEMGAYGLKTVIVVDEDIDPWDLAACSLGAEFQVPTEQVSDDQSRKVDSSRSFSSHRSEGYYLENHHGCHDTL